MTTGPSWKYIELILADVCTNCGSRLLPYITRPTIHVCSCGCTPCTDTHVRAMRVHDTPWLRGQCIGGPYFKHTVAWIPVHHVPRASNQAAPLPGAGKSAWMRH